MLYFGYQERHCYYCFKQSNTSCINFVYIKSPKVAISPMSFGYLFRGICNFIIAHYLYWNSLLFQWLRGRFYLYYP
ncbi:putative integral membrane protein [Babesia bovis T2Bo]|uniref:Uncharacterized protein n=1 Tax=Babesia bovis TaxID=5865 RepID=S6BMM3_BABBO|nr:putative integral membrane protein [Babesia bovis T2Bo]KAG6439972.1 putative integral membrane protein [Babesia bovis T2Bo]BAN65307.1 hypothetical protein [Babesia bovis]